ncbi:MAG TPA: hypothetical protein VM869_04310 [Enhygromyxa sp.]|nr:hypothetical protein [Enhygromyxa sp.]
MIVRQGKIGKAVRDRITQLDSPEAAARWVDKHVALRLARGYVEVSIADPRDACPHHSRHPELEAAILADPDDLGAWAVYFDWLQSLGDPWGERGQLAMAREQAHGANARALAGQLEQFDAAHQRELYGEGMAVLISERMLDDFVRTKSRFGMILAAEVHEPGHPPPSLAKFSTALSVLLGSPAARLLGELAIEAHDLRRSATAIAMAYNLESLRRLRLGQPGSSRTAGGPIGDIRTLLVAAPNLVDLCLRGGQILLGEVEHPRLESLFIHTSGISRSSLERLVNCKLPALRRLTVWFGSRDGRVNETAEALAPLLVGDGLPGLELLGLGNSGAQDEIAESLSHAAILDRLRIVDMSRGTMTELGARSILKSAARFRRLERLDLRDNYLTAQDCAALRSVLGDVVLLDSQRTPRDWSTVLDDDAVEDYEPMLDELDLVEHRAAQPSSSSETK